MLTSSRRPPAPSGDSFVALRLCRFVFNIRQPLVRVALNRPYTFVVMAVLIVLLGVVTISRMATTVDARADGYVRRWLVDLGDAVQDGQLLAELDVARGIAADVAAEAEALQ